MGKQIEFFLTRADEQEFFAFARRTCQLLLLRSSGPIGSDLRMLDKSLGYEPGDDLICMSCEGFAIQFDVVPSKSTQVLNVLLSEVVQLRRSVMIPAEGSLTHGRLWFEAGNSRAPKSTQFNRWADSLLRYIRRTSPRQLDRRYLGRDASDKEARNELHLGRKVTRLSAEEARKKLGLPDD